MHDDGLGLALLAIARNAIAAELDLTVDGAPQHAALDTPGATFVTLFAHEELRGCVGTLEPRRPLAIDVRENALGAAFRDSRFLPLTAAEFAATWVEVSLLSPSESLKFTGEEDLLRQLVPGVDGLIIDYERHRATFLPQVWESLPDPRGFLATLKRKAGLATDFWSPQMNVSRYRVTKWKESELLQDRITP